MLRKLSSIALVIAALVALGEWARGMFFPPVTEASAKELTGRMERLTWPVSVEEPVETESAQPTATTQTSSREVNPVAIANADTARTNAAIVPAAARQSSTSKPATVSPTPMLTPSPSQTVQITSTVTPTPVQTPTPTPEPEAPVYEGMDADYINGILRGLNDRRAANGLPPLSLNASLSQKAQNHAMSMAKEGGGWFHLRAGMIEDSNYHHISDAPSTIGARASEHAPELCMGERVTEDDSAIVTAKVVSVGIGAVRVGDRVYTCLLGEDEVTFTVKEPMQEQ